jgi:hypothetical protein
MCLQTPMINRGQVSLVLIVGIVLLMVVLLSYTAQQTIPAQVYDPFQGIDSCLQELTMQSLASFKSPQYIIYQNKTYSVIYAQNVGTTPITKNQIEEQIRADILAHIWQCIPLKLWQDQGYSVIAQTPQIRVQTGLRAITVTLDYPVKLSKQEVTHTFTQKTINYPVPYIEAITYAYGLIEQKSLPFKTKVHKPYPDTVYEIEVADEIYLRVALLGVDVSTQLDTTPSVIDSASNQQCVVDTVCYPKTSANYCQAVGGTVTRCQTPIDTAQKKSCNQTMEHLQGYCTYYPGVGGRFFATQCIDGIIQTIPCRDFREEVCIVTENKPACVPYIPYQQNCHEQQTNASCLSSTCSWINNSCVPSISRGFAFYKTDLCSNIAQKFNVTTAHTCQAIGDCSYSNNIYGDKSQTNTQALPKESSQKTLDMLQGYVFIAKNTTPAQDTVHQTITQAIFLQTQQLVTQQNKTLCQAYTPPEYEDTCHICHELPECSEYTCRSLSQYCHYVKDTCVFQKPTTNTLQITTDLPSSAVGELAQIHPVVAFQEINTPFNPITISINTSEQAQCKLTYAPAQTYNQIPYAPTPANTQHNWSWTFLQPVNIQTIVNELLSQTTQEQTTQQTIQTAILTQHTNPTSTLSQFLKPFSDNMLNQTAKKQLQALIMDALQQKIHVFVVCQQTQTGEEQTLAIQIIHNPTCENTLNIRKASATNKLLTVQTNILSQCTAQSISDSPSQDKLQNITLECPTQILQTTTQGVYECSAKLPKISREELRKISITCQTQPLTIKPNISNQTQELVQKYEQEQKFNQDAQQITNQQRPDNTLAFNQQQTEQNQSRNAQQTIALDQLICPATYMLNTEKIIELIRKKQVEEYQLNEKTVNEYITNQQTVTENRTNQDIDNENRTNEKPINTQLLDANQEISKILLDEQQVQEKSEFKQTAEQKNVSEFQQTTATPTQIPIKYVQELIEQQLCEKAFARQVCYSESQDTVSIEVETNKPLDVRVEQTTEKITIYAPVNSTCTITQNAVTKPLILSEKTTQTQPELQPNIAHAILTTSGQTILRCTKEQQEYTTILYKE